jgi:hypothetical protein
MAEENGDLDCDLAHATGNVDVEALHAEGVADEEIVRRLSAEGLPEDVARQLVSLVLFGVVCEGREG